MPFTKLEHVEDRSLYLTQIKKELSTLKEGELGPFEFYGDVTIGSAELPVLLVGSYKSDVSKALKAKAKMRATGTCFRTGKILNLTLGAGKMPESQLKALFKEVKTHTYQLVEAQTATPPPKKSGAPGEEAKVRAIVGQLESDFDKVKGKLIDEDRKALRILFGKISDALDTQKWDVVRKLAETLEKDMETYAKGVDPKLGKPDPREKANATQRWKDTMARFDKAKAQLTDDERKELRKLWGAAEDQLGAEKWAETIKSLEKIDAELVKAVKAALKDAQDRAEAQKKTTSTDLSPQAQKLIDDLSQQGKALEKLRLTLLAEMKKVETIRTELREEQAKKQPSKPKLADITKRLDTQKKAHEEARKALDLQRKKIAQTEAELKAQKLLSNPNAMGQLERAQDAIAALEDVLQSTPIDQAREALKATVAKMAEATVWREEQLKKEATGNTHATSRHGAQTGLERQARRAATAESVTPDQTDNPSGSAQVIEWNKVKFTYTVKDGKREIKDRQKVAKQMVGTATDGALPTEVGTMWATPVLEKEAHDLAKKHADKLKQYTHYRAPGTTQWKAFTGASFVIKKSPGWGYAVEHSGKHIPVDKAEEVLRAFEKGDINLDQMLKRLNTTLRSQDGGAKLIPHAVVVFKRGSGAGDWGLLTQYPNHKSTAVGWNPEKNWASANVELRQDGKPGIATLSVNALP